MPGRMRIARQIRYRTVVSSALGCQRSTRLSCKRRLRSRTCCRCASDTRGNCTVKPKLAPRCIRRTTPRNCNSLSAFASRSPNLPGEPTTGAQHSMKIYQRHKTSASSASRTFRRSVGESAYGTIRSLEEPRLVMTQSGLFSSAQQRNAANRAARGRCSDCRRGRVSYRAPVRTWTGQSRFRCRLRQCGYDCPCSLGEAVNIRAPVPGAG